MRRVCERGAQTVVALDGLHLLCFAASYGTVPSRIVIDAGVEVCPAVRTSLLMSPNAHRLRVYGSSSGKAAADGIGETAWFAAKALFIWFTSHRS